MTTRKAYQTMYRSLRSNSLTFQEAFMLRKCADMDAIFLEAPLGKAAFNAYCSYLDRRNTDKLTYPISTRYEIYGWL